MAKQFDEISDKLRNFIEAQKLFFVGTAVADGRVNISPKGMDALRVINPNQVIWLNVTGSGNETAAHVQQNPRMTIMFTAFEGNPMILRLYGKADVIHQKDDDWPQTYQHFPETPGARQIFRLHIDLVQTSCGFGVPLYDYSGERETLAQWATKKGEQGVQDYWKLKNQTSIDGIASHIMEKNT